MKKILLSLLTIILGLSAYAQTEYKFDDAKAWGNYENAAAGEYAQVNSGDVLTQGNIKIAVTFPEGKNGLRFFANSNTGAINLRAYVESVITISTVDGSAMSTVELSGTNLGASYMTGDGYENGTWKGNASSFTIKCIKSTVQINTMKVYSGGTAPKDIANTPETAYTTSEAYALIDAGEGLGSNVYVKGTVTRIDAKSDPAKYGTLIYYITDGTKELEVYGGKNLGNKNFTSVDDLQDGDEVIVYGQLVNFNGTYEFTNGNKLYSLNGKTQVEGGDTPETPDTPDEPYTCVGNGLLETPYTTEDIIKGVYNEEGVSAQVLVWVKGTILGCYGSASNPISDKEAASNIAIGNADGTCVIPVQLVANTPTREKLNLIDNPDVKGKEVWVYGVIQKYFSVAGMKSTSDFSLDGKTTYIKNVSAGTTRNAVYNVSGVKVNSTVNRGVYIVDGVKKYVK